MTSVGLSKQTPHAGRDVRGGGWATLLAGTIIAVVWTGPFPLWAVVTITWLIAAFYWFASLWRKKWTDAAFIRQTMRIAVSLWIVAAACFVLIWKGMPIVFSLVASYLADDYLFFCIVVASVLNYALLGIAVWLWLIGTVAAGSLPAIEAGPILRNAIRRTRSEPQVWSVGAVTIVLVMIAHLVALYVHSPVVMALVGLGAGWMQVRCMAALWMLDQRNRRVPSNAGDSPVAQRERRWRMIALLSLFFLLFGFYGTLLISGSAFSVSDLGMNLFRAIISGALLAVAAWLISLFKPLYWFVLTVFFLFVAVLFAGVSWLFVAAA